MRFTKIDILTRPHHHFLTDDDECFYLGEYTARAGWHHSHTNQLIWNFKIPICDKKTTRWPHKTKAIKTAASQMQMALSSHLDRFTIVPVPPSKVQTHPDYDDRVVQMVQIMCSGIDADIRELVSQKQTFQASHEAANHGNERTSIADLVNCYQLDPDLCGPTKEIIAIIDDVITTGRHYKAMKETLQIQFPDTRIVGFFIARVVPNSDASFD